MSRYAGRVWAVVLVSPLLSAAPGGPAPGGPATTFPSTPAPAEIFPTGAPPATETFHDESEPLHRRVDHRLAAGRYADALGLVRAKAETLRHTRHGEEIIEALARHYSVAGRPEDAQALYHSLMKRDRDNARLHTETGNAYRDNGRYAEALPHFRAGQDQNHPNRYLAMLDEAACLVALGRYAEARRITAWMVHERVVWRERAQQLGDAVSHAQGGSPSAELQLAYGFLSGFGDRDALAHPGVAAAIAARALANWATGAVQKRQARDIIDRARKEQAAPERRYPAFPPLGDPAARAGDYCWTGHSLEAEGKLREALAAFRSYKETGGCGTGIEARYACVRADAARVLYKLGNKQEAAAMFAGAIPEAGLSAACPFVALARADEELRRLVIAKLGLNVEALGVVHTLEELESAVAKKDVAAVLELAGASQAPRLPARYIAWALQRIGPDAVPEICRRLPPETAWSRNSDPPPVLGAMVWALRELRDPRAVRPLWKAHVYMYIRLYREMLDALAAPGPATRQQLIGWLDSDDPVEFYGAVRHVLTPLDPQFWPPARTPRDGRNAR